MGKRDMQRHTHVLSAFCADILIFGNRGDQELSNWSPGRSVQLLPGNILKR